MDQINKKLMNATNMVSEVLDWYEHSAGEFMFSEEEIKADKHLLAEAMGNLSLVGIGLCLHNMKSTFEKMVTEPQKT